MKSAALTNEDATATKTIRKIIKDVFANIPKKTTTSVLVLYGHSFDTSYNYDYGSVNYVLHLFMNFCETNVGS